MVATLFADVSEFQAPVNNRYPYAFISFRANDGTYKDHHFDHNLAWAKHQVATGKLKGFIVYFVWETDWANTLKTFKQMVGTPHPKMAVMIDVESWSGKIRGNHSAGINAVREGVISWLQANRKGSVQRALYKSRDRKRVIIYGNSGDLANLMPHRGDASIVLANYSGNPKSPKHLIHQFSCTYNVPPFGRCDINSADGLNSTQLAAALGLDTPKVPLPKPKPVPVKPGKPVKPTPKPAAPKYPLGRNKFYGEHDPDYNGRNSAAHRAEIKSFQKVLVKHGYAGRVGASWADGIYGAETSRAVNAFRKTKHWPQSGKVGPATWKALFSL